MNVRAPQDGDTEAAFHDYGSGIGACPVAGGGGRRDGSDGGAGPGSGGPGGEKGDVGGRGPGAGGEEGRGVTSALRALEATLMVWQASAGCCESLL